MVPGTSRNSLCRPAPISLQASNPHVLFVHHAPLDPVKSSSSVASRQSTGLVCPSATETHCSGAVRAFLVPPTGLMMPLVWERKKQHGGGDVCGKALCYTVPGAWESKSCLTPSIFHHLVGNGPLHLNPARLTKDLHGNPGNLPRSSPCLLLLPHQ